MLTLFARERRRIHSKDHRDRRFIDHYSRQRDGFESRSNGITNGDALDAGQSNNIAGLCVFYRDLLQSLEGVQLCNTRLFDLAFMLADRDLISHGDRSIEDSTYRQTPNIVIVIKISDQHLQRRAFVTSRRGNGLEYLFKEWAQILAAIFQVTF